MAVILPEVPVIMALHCPRAAVLLAVRVSVVPVEGFEENAAVTPLGRPVTAKLTLPVKPYCELTET